ncbi:hypothetical protein FHX74_001245 [Friedmanniella endophytica]|uniref:Uncharacterized protein n=1 Tax=Microlunatus kandeliicorticis TaxID=1759536 RepID=A0A7W3IR22_9ACTN|nr:hypothetical protein [Microlunatus kandeliicorticis]MBA8793640.1 hypothetical protein [Microlunatus kandeliicorticis]
MPNRDLILLETVKTHRARLASAFVYGELAERRVTNDNVRRLIGGIVLAAVACAICVGFSFVSSLLGQQAQAARDQAAQGPATGPVAASDTFDRQVDTGWGTADRGGRWTLRGPADAYAVRDGAATVQLSGTGSADVRGGYLPAVLTDRSDLQLTLRRTTGAADGTVAVSVLGRRVSSTQDYRALVQLRPDGSVALALLRDSTTAQNGGSSEDPTLQLSPTVILFGGTARADQQPQTPVTVRMQAVGTGTTTLRVKVWQAGGSEPEDWNLTASDTTADLQRPGSVGIDAVRTGTDATVGLAMTGLIGRVAP